MCYNSKFILDVSISVYIHINPFTICYIALINHHVLLCLYSCSCWLASGGKHFAIWFFAAPMIAIMIVSETQEGIILITKVMLAE